MKHKLPEGRREVAQTLRSYGGLLPYVRSLMSMTKFSETSDPRRGDVGVVKVPGLGSTCAIFTGRRWAVRGSSQVIICDAEVESAWRVA